MELDDFAISQSPQEDEEDQKDKEDITIEDCMEERNKKRYNVEISEIMWEWVSSTTWKASIREAEDTEDVLLLRGWKHFHDVYGTCTTLLEE